MRIQKHGFNPSLVNTPERGFYTEADITEIVKRAFQEVMQTFMECDESQDNNNIPSDVSDKKLTLSVQEAADMLGISKPTMFNLLHAGEITHKRIGRKIIISYQAVVDWINQ